MKKILIMYATYGNGHKKIAEYIENYFKTHGDFKIETIDIIKFSTPFFGKLSQKTFEKINFSIPYLWDIIYNVFNRKMHLFTPKTGMYLLFNNGYLKEKILNFNPDLVISTHYFCSTIISKFKNKNLIDSKLITIVTDYEAHEFWLENEKCEDFIILGNSLEKRELIKKGFDKKKIKDIGIPLSDEFNKKIYNKEKTLRKYKLDVSKKTLVFFCSRGRITSLYVKELGKHQLDYNILIITGNNSKLRTQLKELIKQFGLSDAKILGYVNNIPELLNIADLIVTKPGGATVTECLYFNVPMLFIGKHSGQEKANARYLVGQKCALSVSNQFEMMEKINVLFSDEKKLNKLRNNTRKINKSDAMKNLFEISNKLMEDVK